jgi:peroxiredoxin
MMCGLALGGVLALSSASGQEGSVPAVGKPAPAIELPATNIGSALPDKKDAKKLSLSEFKGKKHVVLFFYPKALTGG